MICFLVPLVVIAVSTEMQNRAAGTFKRMKGVPCTEKAVSSWPVKTDGKLKSLFSKDQELTLNAYTFRVIIGSSGFRVWDAVDVRSLEFRV